MTARIAADPVVPGRRTVCQTVDVVKVLNQWPILAGQVRAALQAEQETVLAASVESLEVVGLCGCDDDICQSFYTAAKPDGAYGPGHRNILFDAPWPGYLILDVVQDKIVFVEVLYRSPLD